MPNVYERRLIFLSGKGGVGKTALSQALALALSRRSGKTLWVAFREAGDDSSGEPVQKGENLWHLRADAMNAFEEYAGLKIRSLGLGLGALGAAGLTQLFVRNKLIRYLAGAAPGIHELVLLGKVWHERDEYEHVVVDMPSTGYGVAMFQSAVNFRKLFGNGPLSRDAGAILETLDDPGTTGHCVIALPEEMPLREALDLEGMLRDLFPHNRAAFLLNRRFPHPTKASPGTAPDRWATPFAESTRDYAEKRAILEAHNVKLWTDREIAFDEISYLEDAGELDSEIEERLLSR